MQFSKIPIFTWKLEFYHWQQVLFIVFSQVTGSLSFQENTCQISDWIAYLVNNSLKYKRSFMKNVASAHSSDIHAHARPLDIPRTSGCSTPVSRIRPVSSHRILRQICVHTRKGWNVRKWIIFLFYRGHPY